MANETLSAPLSANSALSNALGFAFPRRRRLRRHNDFLAAERAGKRCNGELLQLVARRGKGRTGLTISKKVSLSAVERNRLRRQLREIVRLHPQLAVGLDLVWVAKPTALRQPFLALQAEVLRLREKLGDLSDLPQNHPPRQKNRRPHESR